MYCPINKFNLGIAHEFHSSNEYAEGILFLLNLDQKSYEEMADRMQTVVKEFNYPILTKKLVELFYICL